MLNLPHIIMPAMGENPSYQMSSLLLHYYLYCMDNNDDLDLMFCVKFECAHMNYIEGQGH